MIIIMIIAMIITIQYVQLKMRRKHCVESLYSLKLFDLGDDVLYKL